MTLISSTSGPTNWAARSSLPSVDNSSVSDSKATQISPAHADISSYRESQLGGFRSSQIWVPHGAVRGPSAGIPNGKSGVSLLYTYAIILITNGVIIKPIQPYAQIRSELRCRCVCSDEIHSLRAWLMMQTGFRLLRNPCRGSVQPCRHDRELWIQLYSIALCHRKSRSTQKASYLPR